MFDNIIINNFLGLEMMTAVEAGEFFGTPQTTEHKMLDTVFFGSVDNVLSLNTAHIDER